MARLVLLPGIDGTGELFAPFLAAYAGETTVVRYPTSEAVGYRELEEKVRAELPTDAPYFLLAESFSGPIAIALASSPPPLLKGVILSCTFARSPRPVLGVFRGLIPFLPARPPMAVLDRLLCGRFSSPTLRLALERALALVSPDVLRARLSAAATVEAVPQLRQVRIPLLYLLAADDRVVPATASDLVLKTAQEIRLVKLAGPHFLLQTLPNETASAVREFMEETGDAL